MAKKQTVKKSTKATASKTTKAKPVAKKPVTKAKPVSKNTESKAKAKPVEPKVERIFIDVKNLKNPISNVKVTESEIAKNPDVYHTNKEVAQRQAIHRLEAIKDTMEFSDFINAKTKIDKF
jgi:hypothetical protein